MQSQRRTPKAVIVCGEIDADRYELWLKVLFEAGADCIAVFVAEDLGFIAQRGHRSDDQNCVWNDIAGPVPVVLVHQGDSRAWVNQIEATTVFWFDTPGSPAGRGTDLRVLRSTSTSSFEVTVEDATEILQYGCGVRPQPPSCCSRKPIQSCLPALAILCQGYLAVYAKEVGCPTSGDVRLALQEMGWDLKEHLELVRAKLDAVTPVQWWLDTFNLAVEERPDEEPRVAPADWEAFKTATAIEWGAEPLPSSLETLFDRLRACQPVDSPTVVAQAYRAIAEHLGNPQFRRGA